MTLATRPTGLAPAMLEMDTHDLHRLPRHPSDPMTPLSGVPSRTASVTHSELDEMWHHNLPSAVLSPSGSQMGAPDVCANAEFDFVPVRQSRASGGGSEHAPSPASTASTTAASVRSLLAEQRLAQMRAEHESERSRRRANVQAHMDRFQALQARRRQLEEQQTAAALASVAPEPDPAPPQLERRGSAFRAVVPTSEASLFPQAGRSADQTDASERPIDAGGIAARSASFDAGGINRLAVVDSGAAPGRRGSDDGAGGIAARSASFDTGGISRTAAGVDAGGMNRSTAAAEAGGMSRSVGGIDAGAINRGAAVDAGAMSRSFGGIDAGGINRAPPAINRAIDAGGFNRPVPAVDAGGFHRGAVDAGGQVRGGGSSSDSGVAPAPAYFKALTGSSREGSDSGLDTTAVSETSTTVAAALPLASPPSAGLASALAAATSRRQPFAFSPPVAAGVTPSTIIAAVPVERPKPSREPVMPRSEASSADDEVLRYFEAAAHSGLPPGLLRSPPAPPAPPEPRSDSEHSSLSAASRRYERRIRRDRAPVPALNVEPPDEATTPLSPGSNRDAIFGSGSSPRTPRDAIFGSGSSPRTPRDAIFGSGPSPRRSEHVARLRASFEAGEAGETGATEGKTSVCSLPAPGPVSPASAALSWRSAQGALGAASMTSSAVSSRTLSPGRGRESSSSSTSGRQPSVVVAGSARPGPGARLDSQFRSPAPPGPLTELEQLFDSLDLSSDLVHRARRREQASFMEQRLRAMDPPPSGTGIYDEPSAILHDDDDVFHGGPGPLVASLDRARPMKITSPGHFRPHEFDHRQDNCGAFELPTRVSESSRTSSDHGSYMTPIQREANGGHTDRSTDSAWWQTDSLKRWNRDGNGNAAAAHMMPSPTSADYLLPRPEKRLLEGFPDVRLDDMAWRRLQRDADSRVRVAEQPFVMRQRDFSNGTGDRRLGAFRPKRGMAKRSRSSERSPSPSTTRIFASDIPLDLSPTKPLPDAGAGGRFISSTVLRFDQSGISTAPATTAFAANGFRPIAQAPVRRPPPPPRQPSAFAAPPPPPPRRHSGGLPLLSTDVVRPLVELGQSGVQTLVPRKFLLHKAASHDDIYIETETPFTFNISATDRDICISKVPSEEEMRQEKDGSLPRPPPPLPPPPSGRRLSGGVPVTLRVVFGSDPALSQRFSSADSSGTLDCRSQAAWSVGGRAETGLAHHDSYRSVYHVDLGTA